MTAANQALDTAMGGDYGTISQLANAIKWASLLTDAALPLDVLPASPRAGTIPADIGLVEQDRAGLRLEAFSQVLAELLEPGWMATPAQLENLIAGRMPGVEN
jgi:hypothetical protein